MQTLVDKDDEEEHTDLEERLDVLAIQIGYLGMAAGFLVFEMEVIRVLIKMGYGGDLPLSNLPFSRRLMCFISLSLSRNGYGGGRVYSFHYSWYVLQHVGRCNRSFGRKSKRHDSAISTLVQ